jgi:anion-transporting  ArsA/GET3 family ATPase
VTNGLLTLVRERRVIVCCGPGGVGKTTTAAAMAIEGARQGRRTCVLTIDPARRLADAFGLDSLTDTPGRVDGAWPGELWAAMLDAKSTFDAAISRYARDNAQAQAIMRSRHYRNLCEALSGTQDYMAIEKLYQLHHDGRFDLIVVDTPPTCRALDFLSAPHHLTRLLDNAAFRALIKPSRFYLRAVAVAAQASLKAAGRVVGAETVLEAVAFLRAFDGMEAGIRGRAQRVLDLFAAPSTAFVLIVAPRHDATNEGQYFAAHLKRSDIAVQALIVNRLHPRFDPRPAATTSVSPATSSPSPPARRGHAEALAALTSNWVELCAVAEREEDCAAALEAQLAPAPSARVPLLARDVHDLAGVGAVADHLFRPHDTSDRSVDSTPVR